MVVLGITKPRGRHVWSAPSQVKAVGFEGACGTPEMEGQQQGGREGSEGKTPRARALRRRRCCRHGSRARPAAAVVKADLWSFEERLRLRDRQVGRASRV